MKNHGFTGWIEKHLLPIANKFARQRHLQAVQSAFLTALPFMMIGSFALILASPLMDYTTMEPGFLCSFFQAWASFADFAGVALESLRMATLGSLSVWVCLGITYYLCRHYKIEVLLPLITTGACFLIMNAAPLEGGISTLYFDGTGLFASIIIAIIATELYRVFTEKKIGQINMPGNCPPALANSFRSLVPVALITILFMIVNGVLSAYETTFPLFILSLMQPLVSFVDNVFGVAFLSLLTQILWWFGIHNTAISAITEPFLISNYTANATAFAAGTASSALPHIFTEQLWWVFMTIGGSGATFALAVLLLKTKSKQLKTVGKLAIVPAFFNINEPIIFGIPIVLNPLFLFPFLAAMTLNGIITYLCMEFGFVARTFAEPGWNLFAPIGAFIATMDWRAVVLVLLLIIMDGLIYYPFLKVYDNQKYNEEQKKEIQDQEVVS